MQVAGPHPRSCFSSKCPQDAEASQGPCFENCPHKQQGLVGLTVGHLFDVTAWKFKNHRKARGGVGGGEPRTSGLYLKPALVLFVL